MKNLFPLVTVFIVVTTLHSAAQTNTFPSTGAAGIGTTSPDASALLDVTSTTRGILIPRMTKTQRDAIPLPSTGLLIYQTNSTPGFYYYTGSAWTAIKVTSASKTLNNLTAPTAVNVDLLPGSTNALSVGSSSSSWKNIYLGGAVYINGNKFVEANGANNTFIGNVANTTNTGVKNTATGFEAMKSNTSGGFNVANGFNALHANTSGSNNTAVGANALMVSTTASQNTALGTATLSSCTTGNGNTALGFETMIGNTTGLNNTAVGQDALIVNTTGNDNVALGAGALMNNGVSGNTATGAYSMFANTTGSSNTANGHASLFSNTTGPNNTAVGDSVMYSNIDGSNNTAIGFTALRSNTTGILNTALGSLSLYFNTTGIQNTGAGATALYKNTTGNANTAIGDAAMFSNTTGGSNTAVGIFAMNQNINGSGNVATGRSSLENNSSGSNNVVSGFIAMRYNTTGSYNVASGYNALASNINGDGNVAIGANAMSNSYHSSHNIAIGDSAMFYYNNNLQNDQLVAVGYRALMNNDVGFFNTAIGAEAMRKNSSGYNNTATGAAAMLNNDDGFDNTGIGNGALGSNSDGNRNSALGSQALINSTGSNNTACGFNALVFTSTGNNNTAVGQNTLYSNTTGSYNTAIGDSANVLGSNLTNATAVGSHARVNNSNSLVLGSVSGTNGATATVKVGIGTSGPTTRLHVRGNGASGASALTGTGILLDDNGSVYMSILSPNANQNGILFGNPSSNQGGAIIFNNGANTNGLQLNAGGVTRMAITSGGFIGIGLNAPAHQLQLFTDDAAKPSTSTWTVISDERLKTNISDFNDGLDVLKKIHPVWFEYNGKADLPTGIKAVGVLAQEIQKIAPYMTGSFKYKDTLGNSTEYLDYNANSLFYILVNSVKALSTSEDLKDKRIKDLESEILEMRSCLETLCNSNDLKSTTQNSMVTDANRLDQNNPNPFKENTSIGFYISSSSGKALLKIFSMNGEEIRSYSISSKGKGQIEIAGNSLAPGLYSYVLIVDDTAVDTKQMIITK